MDAGEERDSFAYGSLGELVPWPDDEHFPNIPADEALDLFLGWVESRGLSTRRRRSSTSPRTAT